MLYENMLQTRPWATLLRFQVGEGTALLMGANPSRKDEPVKVPLTLCRPVCRVGQVVMVPAQLFADGLFAYVTVNDSAVVVERGGNVIEAPLDGIHAMDDHGDAMVDAGFVLARLNVDYEIVGDTFSVIVESRSAGFRKLTDAEEKLPYAKYYHRYFETPLHERADFRTWARKAALYSGDNMQPPEKMLHLRDVNKLMDKDFRENEWHEGWTLFDDGSGVMCAKTEMPGVTAEMFQWWFAWHVLEDIRYMLWCPPSHYGIAPALELRQRILNPNLTLFEKTHDISVHHVYESIGVDYLNYNVSAPVGYFDIDFHDPVFRGFTPENQAKLHGDQGMVAICGSTRMLHFFVENEDGTGGTCFTHFWYGVEPDAEGKWHGVFEKTGGGKNYNLMTPIMTIAQHANKEFPLLATFLPELYAEEKNHLC